MKKLYIGWDDIDWNLVRSKVFKWQQEVFSASKIRSDKAVRKYQNKIVQSLYAKLLSVKRLTQENKHTSSMALDEVMNILPHQRLALAKSLTISSKRSIVRNVCILKLKSRKKRLFHILFIKDRCLQLLFKLAIEPEWEARFEENSYGFRPGRHSHDAISAIRFLIYNCPKYVLVVDQVNCFNLIDHEDLLEKTRLYGKFRKQLKFWLINGVLASKIFSENNPQPVIISSLLANISLHGVEKFCKRLIKSIPLYSSSGKMLKRYYLTRSLGFVRYANSFVLIHSNLAVITLLQNKLPEFLRGIKIEFTSNMIYISHTLEIKESIKYVCLGLAVKPGFNFLGFYIRQYRTFHMSVRGRKEQTLGFVSFLGPSKENRQAHQRKLHFLVLSVGKRVSQDVLIKKLNPVIWLWSKYFCRFATSHRYIITLLGKMDYILYLKLRQWARRVYKTSGKGNVVFRTIGANRWTFATEKVMLLKHIDCSKYATPYVKVMDITSLYVRDQIYWANCISTDYSYIADLNMLLRKQNIICRCCNKQFNYKVC